MTSSVQKSVLSSGYKGRYNYYARRRFTSMNIYQVTVEDFDGCEYDYEVEANSYEEAAAQVECIASNAYIQVYNMNIYLAC